MNMGIKFVNVYAEKMESLNLVAAVMITMGFVLCIVTMIMLIITLIEKSRLTFGVAMFFFTLAILIRLTTPSKTEVVETGRILYEVEISDTMTFGELTAEYEIIRQLGDTYLIVKRGKVE